MLKKNRQSQVFLLTESEYCHLLNKISGVINLVEGPYRGKRWKWWLTLHDEIKPKIVLNEEQYAVISNPFNPIKSKIEHGEREVRQGPCIFSLYPGESLEYGAIQTEYIITSEQGLLLRAVKEFEDHAGCHQAGEYWIIPGPLRFIPHKYVKVENVVSSIPIAVNEGMYIQNVQTGEIKLERGPQSIILQPGEQKYERYYSKKEEIAFKIDAENFDRARAIPLKLENSEFSLIISEGKERIERGPKVLLLEPHERVKIIELSGDTPKRPNVLIKWKIFTGPMFVSDQLSIRTKDNAQLIVLLRYKTKFEVPEENPEKIFVVSDFIGYATETMAAIIRQEAAQHNFEEFHSKASELIRAKIFLEGNEYFRFIENNFTIFGLDIKKIMPEDPKIAAQLNAAIKSNMDIYVNKINQTAQLEAERQLVEGRVGIEESKRALIDLEQANLRFSELDTAEIQAKKIVTIAQGKAEAIRIQEGATNEMSSAKMAQTLQLMENKTIESYLALQKIKSFTNVEKTVVIPSDSRVIVPFGDVSNLQSSNS